MTRLWLIGMLGAGKTTVGRLTAQRLGVDFHDSDEIVERYTGRSIEEIWTEEGEESFRSVEREVIGDLSRREGVIATGGGAILDPVNRALITDRVVWLEASPAIIAARVDDKRPLLIGGEDIENLLTELVEQRSPLYMAAATHRIDTDAMSADEVVEAVVALWGAHDA